MSCSNPPGDAPRARRPVSGVWLRVSCPGRAPIDCRFRGTQVVIGRGDCDVRVEDVRVSRQHCRVVRQGREFVVIDQSSLGTLLNGRRLAPETPTPFRQGDVLTVGPFTIRLHAILTEDRRPTCGGDELPPLVGSSDAIKRLARQVHRASQVDAPVLLSGETGTGKSLVARLLHGLSWRGPFQAVNASTLSGDLVESTLFGHEKGAFTGAQERRDGHFQRAHEGTLFIDEIGDLPLEQQAKLLCALEDREVCRVGATEHEPVDVRIVAATHRDLSQACDMGAFREDLFHRLRGLDIHIPPLRSRPEDIPELVQYFLDQDHPHLTVTQSAVAALAKRRWPGNLRELRQTLTRAAAHTETDQIDRRDLNPDAERPTASQVAAALERHDHRERLAAASLGMTRSTFKRLMERYGIPSRPKSKS